MTQETIITILLGLLAIGVPVATFILASQANSRQATAEGARAEAKREGVDALAYSRAVDIYGDVIKALREQVDRLETSNKKLEAEVISLRSEIATMNRNRRGTT